MGAVRETETPNEPARGDTATARPWSGVVSCGLVCCLAAVAILDPKRPFFGCGGNRSVGFGHESHRPREIRFWSGACPSPKSLRADNAACCCSITDYGAVGDNSTLNTLSIQSAIDECHETCGLDSGIPVGTFERKPYKPGPTEVSVVYVPRGVFRTGSLELRSNQRFHLGRGASIYGSDDPSDYPLVPMIPNGYVTGVSSMFRALLSGTDLSNVAITGENDGYAPGLFAGFESGNVAAATGPSGAGGVTGGPRRDRYNGHDDADDSSLSVIDGMGWKWWCKARSMPIPQDYCNEFNPDNETIPSHLFRPKLIEFDNSTNIILDRFTARNSPVWFIHPFLSKNIAMTNLTVLAPREIGNTDGLDPDSCENVLMDSCYIDVGDDGVSIKSTNHTRLMAQTRNVTMRNLRIVSRNWCIGSATYGGIYDILFEDSTIGDPDAVTSPWAIKFKSHRYYPGPMENITIRRIEMGKLGPTPWMYPEEAGSALLLGLTYDNNTPPAHRSGKPLFRNVTFEDIVVASAGVAGQIKGLPEDCLEHLSLKNISVRGGTADWLCLNVELDSLVVSGVNPPVTCWGGCDGSRHGATENRAIGPNAAWIGEDRYSFE